MFDRAPNAPRDKQVEKVEATSHMSPIRDLAVPKISVNFTGILFDKKDLSCQFCKMF